MIARPVHRPRPIPFDTAATASSQPRAVSWAGTLGPTSQSAGLQHAQHVPSRLSPVKAPLPSGPVPFSAASAAHGTTKRSLHAVASAGHSANHSAAKPVASAPSLTGVPRSHAHNHGGSSMSEVSARYIGHGALSVRSSVTGRHYRFQAHGDSLVIDRNDVVLLKRISDLVIR
jgi:hypothetical protein